MEVALLVLPPLAAATPVLPSAPLSSDPPAVAFSSLTASPDPIAVAASFSDADSSVSSPPHSVLRLRSPPCRYRLRGTTPLTRSCSFASVGPVVCGIPPAFVGLPPASVTVPTVPSIVSFYAPSVL